MTVNDPTMYTKPWTATMILRSTPDQIFEMACHEGNEGLSGALSGSPRAREGHDRRRQEGLEISFTLAGEQLKQATNCSRRFGSPESTIVRDEGAATTR